LLSGATTMRCLILAGLLLSVSPVSAQVTFKQKPAEGVKYQHEITNLTAQTLTIGGMDIKTEADTALVMAVEAGKRDSQGHILQSVKFQSLRSNLMLPGGNISFDSAINLAKSDNDQFSFLLDAFKAMAGASFNMKIDAENKFVSADGFEEILKPASPQANEILKAQFNSDKFRKDHEQRLARYPDKPVQVGDVWDHMDELDLGSGQTLKMERRYEYQGTVEQNGRTLDKITAPDRRVVSLEVDANSSLPFRISKTDLQVSETKSTILFDRQVGAEVENSRVMHLKGKLTLTINGMDLPTDLDLRIESKEAIKQP
jgi:hypothetical protein